MRGPGFQRIDADPKPHISGIGADLARTSHTTTHERDKDRKMTDLTGSTALITGSARGIGKAIALGYAQLGANIVLNYPANAAGAEQALAEVREHGVEGIAVRADISKPADVDRLYAEATKQFGSLDIIVANAGVELPGVPIVELSDEQIDRLVDINVRGAFMTMQRASKNVADNGRVIFISSSSTVAPVAGMATYASTKLAGRYFAGVLAIELAGRGVTVNCILPTAIDQAGVYRDSIPADSPYRDQVATGRIGTRIGTPGDVADAAEYLVGDLAAWVSGMTLTVTGGLSQ